MPTSSIRGTSSQADLTRLEDHPHRDHEPVENTPKRLRGDEVMSALRSIKSTFSRKSKKPQSEGLRVTQQNQRGDLVIKTDMDSLENQRALEKIVALRVPKHLEDLKSFFKSQEAKDTTLIWGHFGGIGRFVAKPAEHYENLRSIISDSDMKHVVFGTS